MSREEEIKRFAHNYSEENYKGDSYEAYAEKEDIAKACVDSIKWADQHPSLDTVKKIICYALKYTNIMLAEDLENSVEWELLIKKAMEE